MQVLDELFARCANKCLKSIFKQEVVTNKTDKGDATEGSGAIIFTKIGNMVILTFSTSIKCNLSSPSKRIYFEIPEWARPEESINKVFWKQSTQLSSVSKTELQWTAKTQIIKMSSNEEFKIEAEINTNTINSTYTVESKESIVYYV